MPRLVWSYDGKEHIYKLDPEKEASIGRAQDNEVQIEDVNSSRRHCAIVPHNGNLAVVDLDSRNGTLVNGELTELRVLSHGDRIEIGTQVIVYEDESSVSEEDSEPLFVPPEDYASLITQDLGATNRLKNLAPSDEKMGEEVEKLYMLFDLNKVINRERDTDHILEMILDTGIQIISAERGFLVMGEGDGFRVRLSRNVDQQTIKRAESKVSRSIFTSVVESGMSLIIGDAADDSRFGSKSILGLKLKSIICVPLIVKGKAIGVLYLDNTKKKGVFSERDLGMVEVMAEQAAIAIENARLIEELKLKSIEIERLNTKLREKVKTQAKKLDTVRKLLSNQPQPRFRYDYSHIVTRSPRMYEIFSLIDKISDSNVSVLIEGESGTGKELIAQIIHANSPRARRPFISENCAAIPSNLMESEFFGHVRGSFTGATQDKPGLFELADTGSLFLDEIGDMHPELQTKLLRVLQTGEVRRVGGKEYKVIDARYIYATNRDLNAMIKENKFREDLYYRLNVIRITLPTLRDRKEDIPLLVEHFLARCAQKQGDGEAKKVDETAMQLLCEFDWPGNVRELENEMERLHALCPEDTIYEDLLSPRIRTTSETIAFLPEGLTLKEVVDQERDVVERRIIAGVLKRFGWKKSRTARHLGISRPTLDAKIEKYGLRKDVDS